MILNKVDNIVPRTPAKKDTEKTSLNEILLFNCFFVLITKITDIAMIVSILIIPIDGLMNRFKFML
jgi:hypothetical protein